MCKVNQLPQAVAVVFDHDCQTRLASCALMLHVSDHHVAQFVTYRKVVTSDLLPCVAECTLVRLLAQLSDERDDLTPPRWVEASVLDQKLRQLVVLAIKVGGRHFQRLRKAHRGCEGWLVYACFVSADAGTAGPLVETDQHPQLVLRDPRALAGSAQAPSEKR